jgi:TPR repeat protein
MIHAFFIKISMMVKKIACLSKVTKSLCMAIIIPFILAGCASPKHGLLDNSQKTKLLTKFAAGEIELDSWQCTTCRFRGAANLKIAKDQAKFGHWADLALNIANNSYQHDLAWYYLGLAAINSGHPKAAIKYFTKSIEAKFHCDRPAATGLCNGLTFPSAAYSHMKSARQLLEIKSEAVKNNASVPTEQPLESDESNYRVAMAAGKRMDFATAFRVVVPIAERGHARSQLLLANLYEYGRGVPQDAAKAVKWYKLSAQQGLALPQQQLGYLYSRGQGVSKNYGEARKWWFLAAKQGEEMAMKNLGLLYEKGRGVSQDLGSAYMWFSLAEKLGEKHAGKFKERVSLKMTSIQITKAKKKVEIWMAKFQGAQK